MLEKIAAFMGILEAGAIVGALICDMLLTLCEVVWSAHEQGRMLGTEWKYVQDWIRQLGQSLDSRRAAKWTTGDYSAAS